MKMTTDPEVRLLLSLGLARRAGQMITGTDMVCEAMRGGKVKLVAEAGNTSDNTHKKLTDKCATYGVPLIRLATDAETLARAVGKTGSLAAAGVTGELFRTVKKAWEEAHGTEQGAPDKA